MEPILLHIMLRHMENKEVTGNRQNGFTKGTNIFLRNLVTFDDGTTWTYAKFDTVPHDILVSKWERHVFEGWVTQWIKNWLEGCTQSCGQWLSVHGESSDGWCPWGTAPGPNTSAVPWAVALSAPSACSLTTACLGHPHLQGRDAILRDLDRLGRWAQANLVMSSKEKSKVLHMDHGNPGHTCGLGGDGLKAALGRRTQGEG